MPRRNKRLIKTVPALRVPGFTALTAGDVLRSLPAVPRSDQRVPRKHQDRPWVPHEYFQVALGRPTPEGAVHLFAKRYLGMLASLEALDHSGIVYVPGQIMAQRALGRQSDSRPNPYEVIQQAVQELQTAAVLRPSANERVRVPLRGLTSKPVANGKVRVIAILGDTRSVDYPHANGLMLGEKSAAVTMLGDSQFIPEADRHMRTIRHFLPVGLADAAAETILRSTAQIVPPGTMFELNPVGPVQVPTLRR